jgi:homoserine kinase type II
LFRDNALFLGAHLAAVIDYYNACTDWLLLDVAITLNDWCDGEGSGLDSACAEALLQGYSRVRPFTAGERQCWQPILCIAAARFWLSRLLAVYDHNVLGLQVQCKDPDAYRNMLLARLACAPPLPD